MSSRIGRMLSVEIFGESHGPAVGVTLDGLPAGLALDLEALGAFLQRRAARGSAIATARRESDTPRVISGMRDGFTTGQPLACGVDARTHRLLRHPRPRAHPGAHLHAGARPVGPYGREPASPQGV